MFVFIKSTRRCEFIETDILSVLGRFLKIGALITIKPKLHKKHDIPSIFSTLRMLLCGIEIADADPAINQGASFY